MSWNRRHFLSTSLLVAVGGRPLLADNAAMLHKALNGGLDFGNAVNACAGLASGSLLVAHTGGGGAVSELDAGGKLLRHWATRWAGLGQDVAVQRVGDTEVVWIASHGYGPGQKPGIAAYDAEGKLLHEWLGHGVTSLAVARRSGRIFGSFVQGKQHGWAELQKQPGTTQLKRSPVFGTRGEGNGQFRHPEGLKVVQHGDSEELMIHDRSNRRTVFCDLEGKWLESHPYGANDGKLHPRAHILPSGYLVPASRPGRLLFQKAD